MTRLNRRSLAVLVVLCASCSQTRGCVESSFTLSPESRLPKWFAATGVSRAEATVTMDYYSGFGATGRTATFTLWNAKGQKVADAVGRLQGTEPLTTEPYTATGAIPYPAYEIVTVDGVTEIIEHRQRGDNFYVSDDSEVRRKLGVK